MKKQTALVPFERIASVIYLVRGQKVMLDRELAMLYGVETRVLNQAVKRNRERFPSDFMLELTRNEIRNISQSVISSATLKHAPKVFAFTEQGVAMLSGVLHSRQAVEVNIMLTLSNYRRHLARLLVETKIQLPYNAGRHAFASYSYQIHGLDKTMRWLGHGDGDLLLATYKSLVTQSEADKFWSIKPKEYEKSNVIRFKQAAG